ncbi:Uncharacterised protein [Achromobacter kerstersii]|nr:Uncharacterised protein [Achromobacter kerstersii]
MGGLHAGSLLEQLASQMRRRAVARRPVVKRIGLFARVFDECFERIDTQRGPDEQEQLAVGQQGDRPQVPLRIKRHAGEHQRVDRFGRRWIEQEGVVVSPVAHDLGARQVAARAAPILHDDGLFQSLGQMRLYRARQHINQPARGQPHDQAHRLGGPGLRRRLRLAARRPASQRQHHQGQAMSTQQHAILLMGRHRAILRTVRQVPHPGEPP